MRNIFLVVFSFLSICLLAGTTDIDKTRQAKEWLSNQPLAFIENKGQFTDSEGKPADNVLFKASYGNCDIYITTEGLSYVFVKYEEKHQKSRDTNNFRMQPGEKKAEKKSVSYYRLDMNLQGSTINKTQIIKELPGKQGVTNYFYPHCPDGIYGVQEYGKITIKNIYKGIDWVIYTNAENKEAPLKYDFVVQPQADYKDIKIKFVNAQSTILADNGTKLKIQTIAGNIEEGNLYSYLQNSIEKQAIKTNYIANSDSTFEFELGAYDKTKTLVIDPLVWATYYGGNGEDQFFSICTDDGDNIYLAGYTFSTDFPTLPINGAYWQATNKGDFDAVILKFDNQGIRQWAIYYGGSTRDDAHSIFVDSQGFILITGITDSYNFPTQTLQGAYNQSFGGKDDAFILKFDGQGKRQWATYYGGSEPDFGISISTDSRNNIFVSGETNSTNFPTKHLAGAYNQATTSGNGFDGFILKFDINGTRQWATFYGGNAGAFFEDLFIDTEDNIYFTGYTNSTNFPTQQMTNTSWQATKSANDDVFILKFNNLGKREWATYYGGSSIDVGFSICADSQDNIYVTGCTLSTDFPTQPMIGAYNQPNSGGSFDIFVLKFNSRGERQWSTYYGGSEAETGTSLSIDSQNNLYITGDTYSTDFPLQPLIGEYWQPNNAGSDDAFILKFDALGITKWSTYYGGNISDTGIDMVIDNQNSVYIAGRFFTGAFTKDYGNGAYYDDTGGASYNGFIIKIMDCNTQKPTSLETDRNDLCINETGNITLTAIGGIGDTLKWYSDNLGLNYVGKGTPLIIPSPTKTTTYYARWESLCDTSECDSVVINIYSQITQNANPIICQGDTCFVGTSKYTSAGIYTDILPTVSGCDSIITTNLTVNPILQSGQDPSICEGDSFVFGTHSYTVTGVYKDTLTSLINGCDSIITTNLTVNPVEVNIQDTSICEGENFTVGASIYTTTGIYTDVLKTALGCDSIVTTELTVNLLPVVSLGNDMPLCPGDSIILEPGDGYISYLWSDGSVLSKLLVTAPGKYAVTVHNQWCPASDEITIIECGSELWFPNAFTPNNDYNNDSFKPVILGTLNTFHIIIYNRWGQQIYESNQANPGWDGTFQGSLCAAGQYVYIATYSMGTEPSAQKQRVQRGSVNLLK